MICTLHDVAARHKALDVRPGALEDFTLGPGAPASLKIVAASRAWSLYCIDAAMRRAAFVELPETIDLAAAPFSVIPQFREARRVLLAPLEALAALAERAPQPERTILVFSIGRCGSTLVNAILNHVEGVWALSEPGALDTILNAGDAIASGEREGLLKAAMRVLFRPPPSRPATIFAIKFRSQSLYSAKALCDAAPGSRNLFLYRDGLGWARSRHDAAQRIGRALGGGVDMVRLWGRLTAGADEAELRARTGMEIADLLNQHVMGALWTHSLDAYEALTRAGTPMLPIRYDALATRREATVRAMLAYCGLPQDAAVKAQEAYAQDSQAGTVMKRTGDERPMGEEEREGFLRVLARNERFSTPQARVSGDAG